MSYEPSRRNFLRTAAVGAAVVGAASATPLLAGPANASTPESHGPVAPQGPVSAFVRDHRTGEVAVMVGEHQIIHHDRALASKLAHIATLAK